MFHVVTGGSGSGKSAFAEQCILDCQGSKRIYIATMYPFDEESYRRIARHRAMRAEKKFTTIERYLLIICRERAQSKKFATNPS